MESNDSNLWDKMREGDKGAFHFIYEDQVAYLYNYGKKICGDTGQVEDAIHDLFVDIWTKREQLGTTDSIRPYLTSSLRRSLVRHIKRSQKVVTTEDNQELTVSLEDSIEDWIIKEDYKNESAAKLKKAYNTLTDRQREIIYLRYHQDMDYEDIAQVLGVKYQSLRNLLSAAVNGLRSAMAILLLGSLCVVMGCSEEEVPAEVAVELQPYFDRFVNEAEARGVVLSAEFERISGIISTIEDASGQCATDENGTKQIRVDQQYWSRASEIKKEFLIFHELGHCYLRLSHDDSTSDDGTCKSIMMSGLGACSGNYNSNNRDAYLDHLFSL